MQSLIYIHTAPIPSLAANAVQVSKMCEAFAGAGWQTTLLAPSPERDADFATLSAAYGLKRPFSFVSLKKPPGALARLGFHIRLGTAFVTRRKKGTLVYTRSIAWARVATLLGMPVVLEVHEPLPPHSGAMRGLARSGKLILTVAISKALAEQCVSSFAQLAGKIMVAPDGADPAPDDLPRATGSQLRVGYVGQLYPGKGIEIIAALVPRCPDVRFDIVGGAPELVAQWKMRLAQFPNAVFHGHVPHAQTSAHIAQFDIVLAPYLKNVEGGGGGNLAEWMSPLKIFEYMAHGKAIIASDLPVLREVLSDGGNALLCDPGDIEAWVRAIERLKSDADLRGRLGAKARADFLSSYTWQMRARNITAAIEARLPR